MVSSLPCPPKSGSLACTIVLTSFLTGAGPMAVLWKGDRRLLNRCYHPIKLLIKDKVVGDRDWSNRPHKIEKKNQRISKMSLSRPPWPFRTYAPQKGSRKLKAQRILILNFVLPLFFPVFLSVLRSWLAWQACGRGGSRRSRWTNVNIMLL